MNWTADQEAKLRDLWAQGRSAGQIAKRMNITRNTVLGKARRLGLEGRQIQTHRVAHATSDGAQLHMNGVPRDLKRADRLLRRFSWQDAG